MRRRTFHRGARECSVVAARGARAAGRRRSPLIWVFPLLRSDEFSLILSSGRQTAVLFTD
jgi:hypothetical protein